MIVRAWALNDLPALRHIAWTTWLATYGTFIPERDLRTYFDTWYTLDKLKELCNAESAKGFVAEIDSLAVGFAKTNFNIEEKKFSLGSLYVLPEQQGKGIGRQLLHASEEFARSFLAGEVWLGVMEQNTAALAWYKNIGFQFVGEEPFTMGNTTVNHLIGFRTIKKTASHGK